MRKDPYNQPLTNEEQIFAEENYGLVRKYLNLRQLPYDEWHDVVILRYLRSVKRWFALPELHKHSFEIVAFYAMRSAIGHELEKQAHTVKTVSLNQPIPGASGLTFMDIITTDNLNLTIYMEDEDMKVKYDVDLPVRKVFRGGVKSDEVLAIEKFLTEKTENMCFEYESEEEAKRKLASVQAYRRKQGHKKLYDVYRSDTCIYVVRMKPKA